MCTMCVCVCACMHTLFNVIHDPCCKWITQSDKTWHHLGLQIQELQDELMTKRQEEMTRKKRIRDLKGQIQSLEGELTNLQDEDVQVDSSVIIIIHLAYHVHKSGHKTSIIIFWLPHCSTIL